MGGWVGLYWTEKGKTLPLEFMIRKTQRGFRIETYQSAASMVRCRCCVCLVLKDSSVVPYYNAAGRRCRSCYQMGRELCECSRCVEENACRCRGANWYCEPAILLELAIFCEPTIPCEPTIFCEHAIFCETAILCEQAIPCEQAVLCEPTIFVEPTILCEHTIFCALMILHRHAILCEPAILCEQPILCYFVWICRVFFCLICCLWTCCFVSTKKMNNT